MQRDWDKSTQTARLHLMVWDQHLRTNFELVVQCYIQSSPTLTLYSYSPTLSHSPLKLRCTSISIIFVWMVECKGATATEIALTLLLLISRCLRCHHTHCTAHCWASLGTATPCVPFKVWSCVRMQQRLTSLGETTCGWVKGGPSSCSYPCRPCPQWAMRQPLRRCCCRCCCCRCCCGSGSAPCALYLHLHPARHWLCPCPHVHHPWRRAAGSWAAWRAERLCAHSCGASWCHEAGRQICRGRGREPQKNHSVA